MVRICEDGSVNYITGASDVGQGSDTVMCAMVAEVLGIGLEDIDIKTSRYGLYTCGSRHLWEQGDRPCR